MVNVMVRLDFELTYYDSVVQGFNHDAMSTTQLELLMTREKKLIHIVVFFISVLVVHKKCATNLKISKKGTSSLDV